MPTLDWIGKQAVVNHHQDVPYHLLRDVPELGCGPAESGNLIVEGDNLTALKALLPYYAGQVKCIYIDPPYNTGNEGWVYNDNVNSPEINAWLGKVVGKEAEDLSRHDKWLCMMYPRLRLLRDFLTEDGLIFISIDENEQRYAELIADEIFGPANRLQTLIWKKSYGGGAKSKHIVNLHEYVLCFARNKDRVPVLSLPPDETVMRYYKYKDEKFQKRGPYRLQPLATNSMDPRPNLRYAIPWKNEEIWPEKQWQWAKERALTALANDELSITESKGKWTVNYKQYLRDEDGEERRSKLYSVIDKIYTQQGTAEIEAIFGDGKKFSFPKPPDLVKQLISLFNDSTTLILDSFGGSGTTAHAALKLNAEDGGTRRFILTEMDPVVAREITAERVRRVSTGYTTPTGRKIEALGGGFRYVQLGESLFDAAGIIRNTVRFRDLARHVFFTETGTPLPHDAPCDKPLLGVAHGTGVYLLYNGILKDRSVDGGNVLTQPILDSLPPHDGPKVIYAASNRVSPARLRARGITFKQTPYAIKVR